jgi:hypothetical protein
MLLLLDHGAKVDPPGTEWEDLIKKIELNRWLGHHVADRLRELQHKYGEASRRGKLKKY